MSLKFTFKNINRVASSNVKRQIVPIYSGKVFETTRRWSSSHVADRQQLRQFATVRTPVRKLVHAHLWAAKTFFANGYSIITNCNYMQSCVTSTVIYTPVKYGKARARYLRKIQKYEVTYVQYNTSTEARSDPNLQQWDCRWFDLASITFCQSSPCSYLLKDISIQWQDQEVKNQRTTPPRLYGSLVLSSCTYSLEQSTTACHLRPFQSNVIQVTAKKRNSIIGHTTGVPQTAHLQFFT